MSYVQIEQVEVQLSVALRDDGRGPSEHAFPICSGRLPSHSALRIAAAAAARRRNLDLIERNSSMI